MISDDEDCGDSDDNNDESGELQETHQARANRLNSQMASRDGRSTLGSSTETVVAKRDGKKIGCRDYMDYFWKCLTNDPVFKKQMTKRAHFKGINSVSKCDKLARIAFPCSFLLLNIIYWYHYYN